MIHKIRNLARPLGITVCFAGLFGFLFGSIGHGAPGDSKSNSIKELVRVIEVSDLENPTILQQMAQDADHLEYRELADMLDEMALDNGSDPELGAHLQLSMWEYLDRIGAANLGDGDGGVAAPPANDLCTAPTVISAVPFAASMSAAEATDDTNVNPSCDSSSNGALANNGVWFTYTPAVSCTAQLSEGSTNDTAMSIWTGASCAALTQFDCSDPESDSSSLIGGTTYYILVSTWGTGTPTGNYTFAFDCTTAAPANDSCAGATVISTVPFLGATSAVASTDDTNALPSCDSTTAPNTLGSNNGAWWRFTPTVNCTAVFSELSSLDIVTTIWTGTCPTPLVQSTCSDLESNITFPMIAGTPYYIMISMWSATNPTSGAYTLAFDCAACGDGIINGAEACDGAAVGSCTNGCTSSCTCAPPANDECSGASQVFDGNNPFTNAGATVGTDAKCDTNLSADVWYYYNATCSGAATVNTCGGVPNNGPDTVLQIYDGCACPPTTTVGCADDTTGCGTSGFASSSTFPVTSGNCYRIRLANYSSAGTTAATVAGTLAISCAPAVCGNNTVEPGEACDGTSVPAACVHGCAANCQCAAPANDNCAAASPAGDGVVLLNRAHATTDGAAQPNPPCDFPFGDDQIYNDVWLDYTASCTGRLLVDTCNGAGLDTRLAVYPGCGCPAGADPLSCNDDSGSVDEMTDPDLDPDTCNQLGDAPFESATRNQVVAGNCYKIRVGAFSPTPASSVGVDELFIQCITKGACCDNTGACTEGQIPAECSGSFFVGADCEVESCCLNGVCSLVAPECCQSLGGIPGGPGSDCDNCGNGIVDCGEQCDGGDCCTATCTYAAGGTSCRPASDICDAPEACDGFSAACPPDGYTSGNLCRPAAGDCDAPESCDGSGPACPADGYLSGNTCRPTTGPCDPSEFCDGSGVDCPADVTITACINGDGCCPAGCNGNNDDDCPPVAIPTVSEWGLAILVLIGLVAGTFLFKRRVEVVS